MRYRITHRTEYHYGMAVAHCHNITHLTPRETDGQRVLTHAIEVDPTPDWQRWRGDFFGNRQLYFALQRRHRHLLVTAVSEVEVTAGPAPGGDDEPWERTRDALATGDGRPEVRQFLLDSPLVAAGPELLDYAAPSFAPGRGLMEAVRELAARIHAEFLYAPGSTGVTTPLAEVLGSRRGVCQDFAQLAIGCLRSLGLAARYVSGYLETRPPPGQPRLVGADASHAWFSLYHPVHGWVDFDPTNDLLPAARHMVTAWGRDYSDVPPVKGVIFGGGSRGSRVTVDVEPLEESPGPCT